MAKQSGLGDAFYVGGYDLSGDTASLDEIGGGPALLDVTGINKSAFERIGGLRDGRIEWTSHFNPAENQQHEVLASLPSTDRHLMYFRGTTLGSPAAALIAKQLNYDWTRADDGKITMKVRAESNAYGIEWGQQFTAGKRTDTQATDGTAINLGGAGSAGAQFYLQVFDFTGTDITIAIESSSDNGAADDFAALTGGSFTQVTSAQTVERIQTARDAAIEQYLRVSTSGTFTSCTFAVVGVVNATTVVF